MGGCDDNGDPMSSTFYVVKWVVLGLSARVGKITFGSIFKTSLI